MRVLVTGSSGQLGREIARQLAADHDVLGLDLLAGPRTTHQGSVTDRALIHRLCAEVDAIVHSAALHAPHIGQFSDEEFQAVNVEGTRHLLEAARARNARFVHTSTTSVYGDAMLSEGRAVWVTEELPPEPRDIYDRTKLAAEALCHAFAKEHGLVVTSLRISRMFPEEGELVARYRLYRGVDPRDAAAAHVLALTAKLPGFEIFNISGRSPFLQDDLVELKRNPRPFFTRCESAFLARGWRLPDSIDRVYVTTKAEHELGYAPRYGLDSLLGGFTGRWLYHLVPESHDRGDPYAPPSLAAEGFLHCSYRPAVLDSARLYFPAEESLRVFQIDPRRLGVAIEEVETPRGSMPHVYGPLRRAAVTATFTLSQLAAAPDRI